MNNAENMIQKNPAIGRSWDEVRAELFTEEEIAESDLRVSLIGELIKARQEQGISQKKLEELSGVKQIDSFDSSEFLLETTLGWMLVSGKDLTLGKLDTDHGDVIIKGSIDSMTYVSGKKGQERGSLFNRLFK